MYSKLTLYEENCPNNIYAKKREITNEDNNMIQVFFKIFMSDIFFCKHVMRDVSLLSYTILYEK